MGRRAAGSESRDCGSGKWAERCKSPRRGGGRGERVPEVHGLAGGNRGNAAVSPHGHSGCSGAYAGQTGRLTTAGNETAEEKRRQSTAPDVRTRTSKAFDCRSRRN